MAHIFFGNFSCIKKVWWQYWSLLPLTIQFLKKELISKTLCKRNLIQIRFSLGGFFRSVVPKFLLLFFAFLAHDDDQDACTDIWGNE